MKTAVIIVANNRYIVRKTSRFATVNKSEQNLLLKLGEIYRTSSQFNDETLINKLYYFISKSFVLFSHKIVRQNYLVYIFGATIVNMSSIMHG